MYTVYILFSSELIKYYVGFTSTDINDRLYKHLHSNKGFTSKVKDWKLLYTETYDNKLSAIKREKEIKNWKSAVRISMLINNHTTE